MNIIKLAAYEDKKLYSKANDTISLSICKLEDSKNRTYLDWNKIKIGGEAAFNEEVSNFVNSGKARGMIDRAKAGFEKTLETSKDIWEMDLGYSDREHYETARDNSPTWKSLLCDNQGLDSLTYQQNPGFIYLMSVAVVDEKLAMPDADSIQAFFDEINQGAQPLDKNTLVSRYRKMYLDLAQGDAAVDLKKDAKALSSLNNQWICMPGDAEAKTEPKYTQEDIRNILKDTNLKPHEKRVSYLRSMCSGTGWCIGGFQADGYVRAGNHFIYMMDGVPQLCLRMSGSRLAEFQGINNELEPAYVHAQAIYDLCDKYPNLKKIMDSTLKQIKAGEKKVEKYNAMQGSPPFATLDAFKKFIDKHKKPNEAAEAIFKLYKKEIGDDYSKLDRQVVDTDFENLYGIPGSNFKADDKPHPSARPETEKDRKKKEIRRIKREEREAKEAPMQRYIRGACAGIFNTEDKMSRKDIIDTLFTRIIETLPSYSDSLSANMRKALPYLTIKTINENSGDEAFKEATKNAFIEATQRVKLEYYLSRYSFLKSDREVQELVIDKMIQGVKNIGGDLNVVEPNRLNNSMKGMPMKHPNVQKVVFEKYIELAKLDVPKDNQRKALDDLATMMKSSGSTHLFKDIAVTESIKALTRGDLDMFNHIRLLFELDEDLDAFKDKAFESVMSGKASELYVDKKDEFDDLNDFFDGKLMEEENFVRIYQGALDIVSVKIIPMINNDTTLMSDYLERFPEVKQMESVQKQLILRASHWIMSVVTQHVDIDYFSVVDKMVDGLLTEKNNFNSICVNAIVRERPNIKTIMRDDLNLFSRLNRRFEDRLVLDRELYNHALELAVEYMESESKGSTEHFMELNDAFGGRLVEDMDDISEKLFEKNYNIILISFATLNAPNMIKYDKLTKGLVTQNKDKILEDSLEKAIAHARSSLLKWEIIKEEPEPNPILEFGKMNKYYQGKLMESPIIQKDLKETFFNCLDYKNHQYFDKTRDLIRYLFRGEVMSEEEISQHMSGRKENAKARAMALLDGGDIEELSRILMAYPSFTRDEDLKDLTYKKIYRFLNWNRGPVDDSLDFVSKYDRLFQGELRKIPKLHKLVMNNLGGWEPRANRGELTRPPAPRGAPPAPRGAPQQQPQVPEDNFDDLNYGDREAKTWYNVFKTN